MLARTPSSRRHPLSLGLSLCCLVLGTGSYGCKSNSFSGSSNSASKAAQPQAGANPQGSGNGQGDGKQNGPGACGAAGKTQAQLRTQTFANGNPGNFLQYEISVTDCSGNAKSVSADVIKFDLDAILSGGQGNQVLDYVVQSPDAQARGRLVRVPNVDLFNNQGPNFFHFNTDQPFQLNTASSTLLLTIQLGGLSLVPLHADQTHVYNQVETYLSFGDAVPVTNVVQLQ